MRTFLNVFLLVFLLFLPVHSEEGMFPLSEIGALDLQTKGFKIGAVDIYNPQGISLIDGIIKLSGCTASFVSADGLILTNHHCAFRSIQSVSTETNDFLREGFLARTRDQELEAKSYTVRINESYHDVSREVLAAVRPGMTYAQRTKAIDRRKKELVVESEHRNPGKRAEVAEMFIGRTYVLFIYIYLKDVRLVYAPPRSIGEFGGEVDNWMWPRHTGDFSFMRAYVAPDGKPADYSLRNVPYRPKRFLRVNPHGAKAEDLVFLLGYPGRTYRHRSSRFLAFEESVRMPRIVKLYRWRITAMKKMAESDRGLQIKLAPRMKGYANRMKNYRGKLRGMKRLDLTRLRRDEEAGLKKYIEEVRPQYIGDNNHSYVFISHKGGEKLTVWGVRWAIQESLLRSGLKPIKPYSLRGTAATQLLLNGMNVVHISKLLGHSRIETTQYYLRVDLKKLNKEIQAKHPRERMEKYLKDREEIL